MRWKDGWNVRIRHNEITGGVEIYLLLKNGGAPRLLSLMGGGQMELGEVEEGEQWKPTIAFGIIEGSEILKELANAIDEVGIKTDKDAKTEGILEATRVHLEDMRKLVFNSKGEKI